ncbi:hypothetical protein V5O48_003777 [Marasmius crinis-equi]|uniref:Spindle pole body component n=1 Tax=Marasmius crinis-equi TaxID=585013 RepID=A0ABR3FRV7_9AGAR
MPESHRHYACHSYRLRPTKRVSYFPSSARRPGGKKQTSRTHKKHELAAMASQEQISEESSSLSSGLEDELHRPSVTEDELQYPLEEHDGPEEDNESGEQIHRRSNDIPSGIVCTGSESSEEVTCHILLPFTAQPRKSIQPVSARHPEISSTEDLLIYAVRELVDSFNAAAAFSRWASSGLQVGTFDTEALMTVIIPGLDSLPASLNTFVNEVISVNHYALMFFESQLGKPFSMDELWDSSLSGFLYINGTFPSTFGEAMHGMLSSIRRLRAEIGVQLGHFRSLARARLFGPQSSDADIRSAIEDLQIFHRGLGRLSAEKDLLASMNPSRDVDLKFIGDCLASLKRRLIDDPIVSLLLATSDSD